MNTMKKLPLLCLALAGLATSCNKWDDFPGAPGKGKGPKKGDTRFEQVATIQIGGETAAEISAFDPKTKKLFTVNAEANQISVTDLSEVASPLPVAPIQLAGGTANSVAIHGGILAIAVENTDKQANGSVLVYDTETQQQLAVYPVGPLPDMVTFSPNGKFIVVANEGEPNDDYTVDPKGSVSIIKQATGEVRTLEFDAFNGQEAALESQGFRVFGPGADLSMDVEPEYVVISDNSRTAWVSLQENNGIARIDLNSGTIEGIYPLGFKDYSDPFNAIDPSDRDDLKELRPVPAFGMFQPDGMAYVKIRGMDFVITANEGDARDYDGFSEEARVEDILLDPTVFPNAGELQAEANLGRLEITTTLGDADGDGDYDEIYSYGARSFSIWSGTGDLVYDSGNDIAAQTLALTPDRFNDDDGRSDAKGGEPEAVAVLEVNPNQYLLFVGLERNDQILVYDISNPYQPEFLDILSHPGDEAPEGLIVVEAKDSPSGKALVIVSNEDSGTVTIYQN
jgi:hypothetical protein